jgi:hypothetical protein
MSNKIPRSDIVVIVVGTAVSALGAVTYLKIHRDETKKRQEIQRQGRLDIKAIGIAAEVIHERMNDPEYIYKGVGNMMEDFQNEIEFQKIAVREDV